MRCAQARKRLTASHGDAGDDHELIRHLETCAECAAFARAERALSRDLAAIAATEGPDDMPLSDIQARVEAQSRQFAHSKFKEGTLMSAALRQIKRRPTLSFSMAALVVILLVATLVPFSFTRTIGYEVAIAGVDRELAVDTAKVGTLLNALGVKDAAIAVGDCDTTCVLKISSLQTENDVELVTTAFAELGDFDCEGVRVICDTVPGTLLNKVRHMVVVDHVAPSGDETTHDIAIKTIKGLDSLCGGDFNIYWTGDSDASIVGAHVYVPGSAADSNMAGPVFAVSGTCGDSLILCAPDGKGRVTTIDMNDPDALEQLKKLGIEIEDGNLQFESSRMWIVGPSDSDSEFASLKDKFALTTRSDNKTLFLGDYNGVHRIDLSAPDAAEQLKALGTDIETIESGDGTVYTIIKNDNDSETVLELKPGANDKNSDYDNALEETAPEALPEGFELKQNHPNPFNPTTRISFAIPEAEHVSLQIFNVDGRKVKTLVDGDLAAGEHTYEWDSTDDSGHRVATGVYLYRLTAGDVTATKKMTLIK